MHLHHALLHTCMREGERLCLHRKCTNGSIEGESTGKTAKEGMNSPLAYVFATNFQQRLYLTPSPLVGGNGRETRKSELIVAANSFESFYADRVMTTSLVKVRP